VVLVHSHAISFRMVELKELARAKEKPEKKLPALKLQEKSLPTRRVQGRLAWASEDSLPRSLLAFLSFPWSKTNFQRDQQPYCG